MTRTDKVDNRYAVNTTRDLEWHRDQARMIAERTPAGGRVLEIAPGPGYPSIAGAESGDYEITGLDLSTTFVELATVNTAGIPFEDGTFDSVLCCVAFKNFAQPVAAVREMRRVLKPGGRALIVDLREIKRMGTGPMGSAMTRFIPGKALPRRAYTKAQLAGLLDQAGITSYDISETPISLVIDIYK